MTSPVWAHVDSFVILFVTHVDNDEDKYGMKANPTWMCVSSYRLLFQDLPITCVRLILFFAKPGLREAIEMTVHSFSQKATDVRLPYLQLRSCKARNWSPLLPTFRWCKSQKRSYDKHGHAKCVNAKKWKAKSGWKHSNPFQVSAATGIPRWLLMTVATWCQHVV